MLLVVDIGNSNIVFGLFKGTDPEPISTFRVKSDASRTFDEYQSFILSVIAPKFESKVTQAIISSVVPPLTSKIQNAVKEAFKVEALIVQPGIKTGIAINIPEPKSVGADRIVNAVAAKTLYGAPALVVDFGTATSFDYIDNTPAYCGGAIAPGLEISVNALVERTAKLPKIDLVWPEKVIGNCTVSAMLSGSVLGYACMVEGLIEKFEAEKGEFKQVVLTGGLGYIFNGKLTRKVSYEPFLTLKGLKILAEINNNV